MEDKEIISLYFARDESAITETSKKYGRMLYAIAGRILNNRTDCEECENDTYLAAWNKIPPRIPNSLSAFLGRIVRNIALDRYDYCTADKRNREFEVTLTELSDILPDSKHSPEMKYETAEISACITAYLRGKSYPKRTVFVRRYWYCDSIAQIAADCGFTESKVKSMLMRMRKELKTYLERNEINI